VIDLRELQEQDREQLFHWRRSPEVDRWLYSMPPATPEDHGRWFERFMADPDQTGWIITSDGGPCGFLQLKGLTGSQRRAEYHWYIGEAVARGRGAGRAAQALGLDRAFSRYDLQKVWSEVRADNEPALKAQAAAGFRREGYLRRHAFKHGAYHDVVLLAILTEEWTLARAKVAPDLAASGLIRGDDA
jgi:UDP-4-amino-4,6-dideoxy-N-acetyl-beta-L-altrosamine N-acetyltransferase